MILIQRLLGFLALFGLVWAVRRLLGGIAQPRGETRRGTEAPPKDEGTMVRDRVCNTFLPRSRALPLNPGDQEHFFCSERCRQTYLERLSG